MYCDVCGDRLTPAGRPSHPFAPDPSTVFVDTCSDECAAIWRAEQDEGLCPVAPSVVRIARAA